MELEHSDSPINLILPLAPSPLAYAAITVDCMLFI
jgi:hypothetical protein